MYFRNKIIAEVGSVHDGSFGNACRLVDLASECDADFIKFQTHLAEAETLINAPMPSYFKGEPRYEYFKRTEFSVEQWRKLKEKCDEAGVGFLSSPFSIEAVDLLETIGISAYKIPSGEVNNLPLLNRILQAGKPILISSGMSSWKEIETALSLFSDCADVTLMQCSSAYPCPPSKVGLNIIAEMKNRFEVDVGFSDHTNGLAAPIAAAALGCTVIEKHLTFSQKMYGSDAANAMEPLEFKAMVGALREVWDMLANPVNKDDLSDYKEMKFIFEKSIVSARALKKGHLIELADLAFKKPGDGIPAGHYSKLIGKCLNKDVSINTKFEIRDFE